MSKNKNDIFLKSKIPRALTIPTGSRTPRIDILPSDHTPEFKAEQMDLEGPWGWNKFDPLCMQELMQRIFEAQKITWQEIGRNGSHPLAVSKLIPLAQKRLMQIEKDDMDELYSFRISGQKRVWGIQEGKIFWILWWDPKHEVCPSLKKHT